MVPGGAFKRAMSIPKISDFGLSRFRGEATSMSRPSGTTPPPPPPARWPSEATDVYWLGMVIYEVLTRRAPFQDVSAGGSIPPKLVEAGTHPRLPLSVGQAFEGEGGSARAVQAMSSCSAAGTGTQRAGAPSRSAAHRCRPVSGHSGSKSEPAYHLRLRTAADPQSVTITHARYIGRPASIAAAVMRIILMSVPPTRARGTQQ